MGDTGNYKVPLGRGSKIKITISKKKHYKLSGKGGGFNSKPKSTSSGLMPVTHRTDDYATYPAGGVLVNVYDFGQIKVGTDDDFAWRQLAWYKTPVLNIDPVIPHQLNSISPIEKTDWDSMVSKIFEVTEDNWQNKYRKIEFDDVEVAFGYGLDILTDSPDDTELKQGTNYFSIAKNGERKIMIPGGTTDGDTIINSKWTDKGLKLKKSLTNIRVTSAGTFARNSIFDWTFQSGVDDQHVKITETNSYAADAVSNLTLGKTIDLFLVPLIALPILNMDDPFDQHHKLIGVYEPIPRGMFSLTNLSGFDQPVTSFQSNSYPKNPTSVEAVSVLFDFYRAREGTVYYFIYADGTHSFPAVASFSFNSSADHEIKLEANDEFRVPEFAGVLLAVIKSGDKTYYVWNTQTEVTFRDSGGSVPIRFIHNSF